MSIFGFFRNHTIDTIPLIKSYIETLEEHIQNEILNHESKCEEKEYNNDILRIRYYLTDQDVNLEEIYCEYFPNLIRRNVVVLIFSVIESYLLEICSLVYEIKKFTLKLKDLAGSSFERYFKYLTKVANFDLEARKNEWIELTRAYKIRNKLVHTNGYIEQPLEKEFNNYVTRLLNLQYINLKNDELIIKKFFLDYLLENVKGFLEEIEKNFRKVEIEHFTRSKKV